jgi:hypothetical protein
MLLRKINPKGEGLVEAATLLSLPMHIVPKRSLLIVNERPDEVACILTANG